MVGSSSLSAMRTRPDLVTIAKFMCIIAVVLDSGQLGGFDRASASV